MTKLKECIAEARTALNLFTGEELESYVKSVTTRARELHDGGVPFALEVAKKEINKAEMESILHQAATAARDIGKWDINDSKMINLGAGLRDFMEKSRVNRDYNVETYSNRIRQELYDTSFAHLSKEDMDMLAVGELDDSIYAYADGVASDDPIVRKIADSLKDYPEARNAKMINSDALHPSEINNDRYFRNTYNPSKLLKIGRENWVAKMKTYLDLKATFKNTRAMDLDGTLDMAIVDDMISHSYDNIIQGNGVLFTKPVVAKDAVAIQKTRHQFYVYKDWKNWGMANKEFGNGSLLQSWLNDVQGSSKKIGMAEIFGSRPESMYLKMRHEIVKRNPETGIKASVGYHLNDALFKQMLGVNKVAWSPDLANLGSIARSLSSMARLGKIVIKSLSDISQIGSVAQRAGYNYWGAYFNGIVNAFNLMPNDARIEIAKMMSASMNTHMGYVSRHIESSDMGNIFNKMSNKFFHGIGLTAWDGANRISAMEPIVRGLGRDSTKRFEDLHIQTQSYLKKFNISSTEWDALRSTTEKGLLTLDNVNRLNDESMRALWEKSDKLIPYSQYRSNLYNKVFAMFDAAQEFAVLNPTAYSRMISTGNTLEGTINGEAIRMIMQFKQYPITYMRRVWSGGMQDFDSYQAKMMYATNMMLGTMMLASLTEVLDAVSNGLTPPDPRRMNRSELQKYTLKLVTGGLGVFNIALDDKKQMSLSNIAGGMVATPSLRVALDPIGAALAVATGNPKGAKSLMKDWVKVANPIGTTPIVSPYVDAFLGNKPYIEPGQRPLF